MHEIHSLPIIIAVVLLFFYGIAIFIITILSRRHLINGTQYAKGLVILFGFLVVSLMSALTITGYVGGELDHRPYWPTTSSSYQLDNETYNVSVKIDTVTTTINDFFINSYFYIEVTDGYVEYTGNAIPTNDTIEVRLYFHPHIWDKNGYAQRYSESIRTKYKGDGRFDIINLNKPMKYKYLYSGPKNYTVALFVNGQEVEADFPLLEFIDVQPAIVKYQLNLVIAVTVLTYWIIFLTLLTQIGRFVNWLSNVLYRYRNWR